jgi:heptosyltransferase-2
LGHVTWLVDQESLDLLRYNPYIQRALGFDLESVLALRSTRFDLLMCLDKEAGLTALATQLTASEKRGFGMNEYGNLTTFNPAAEYAYRLGIDDELKFRRNQKTYQEIIHEVAEVPYARDEYVFILPDEAAEKARRFFQLRRIPGGRPFIGLNTGAGTKFGTKQWPAGHYLKLISELTRKIKANVFLLGGPREKALNRLLARKSGARVYDTGTDNALLEFAGFISLLDLVVSSDTLGMHLAIALKKPVIALFGPTCPQEIDLYGRGAKLYGGVACSPCYRATCPDAVCMSRITPERVSSEVKRFV